MWPPHLLFLLENRSSELSSVLVGQSVKITCQTWWISWSHCCGQTKCIIYLDIYSQSLGLLQQFIHNRPCRISHVFHYMWCAWISNDSWKLLKDYRSVPSTFYFLTHGVFCKHFNIFLCYWSVINGIKCKCVLNYLHVNLLKTLTLECVNIAI